MSFSLLTATKVQNILQIAMQSLQKSQIFFVFLQRKNEIETIFLAKETKLLLMTLHIFNPEHDIALASNLSNFTAPKAGRQLRHDLGFLPALWAKEGDCVLVDDIEVAQRGWENVCRQLTKYRLKASPDNADCLSDRGGLPVRIMRTETVEPWGWDRALCAKLSRLGINEALLPTDEQLQRFRQWSHRHTAARLLPLLQQENVVGEAFECFTMDELSARAKEYDGIVVKAPWSSSGRGVRMLLTDADVQNAMKWMENVITSQGSIMVEPFYQKVMDLGMEFTALPSGDIRYDGLSLFDTHNSAYTGNLLATESTKRNIISRYIPVSLLDNIKQKIKAVMRFEDYTGPLGVDMMIVANTGNGRRKGQAEHLLHPCVEINLRRTMGHVALSLTPASDDELLVMNISYDGSQYLFNIKEWQQT